MFKSNFSMLIYKNKFSNGKICFNKQTFSVRIFQWDIFFTILFIFQAAEEAKDGAATPAPGEGESTGSKKLTNQFNYSERASQTYNNPYRVSYFTKSYYKAESILLICEIL